MATGPRIRVIGRLIDARDAETGATLDREALRNEIAVLFMAGHETTANTMAWIWYLLSQAPDVEARLHEEIDTVLAGRPASLADVPKLTYTRAVLDEAMRLYPPVPILPREALQDETFEGQRIPKGSLVLVVPWLLHRHRKLWDEPDAFIPERFLGERAARIPKFAYLPFSIGPRVCAGLAFGLTESVLGIATSGAGGHIAAGAGRYGSSRLQADAAPGERPADDRAAPCGGAAAAAGRPGRWRGAGLSGPPWLIAHTCRPFGRCCAAVRTVRRRSATGCATRAMGGLNLGLHHALRALPTDWCSAFGAANAGCRPRRYSESDARARRLWRALRPLEASPAEVDAAMRRLWRSVCAHHGRIFGAAPPVGRGARRGDRRRTSARCGRGRPQGA